MTEGDDDENETKRDESFTDPQPNEEKRSANQLYEWNRYADQPKGPDRQKRIGEGQEILFDVLERSQLKDFPDAGHEEDQAKNKARE